MRIHNLLSLLLSSFILFLAACQPGILTQKTDEAQVDSSLYFQQVAVRDAFMDTVFSTDGQSVQLTKKVMPLPPLTPEMSGYKEREGFRVQVFAGLDSINAVLLFRQARQITRDSTYLFKDKGLFKIQVGDYPFRYQADSTNMNMRKNGFPGAWVVKGTIRIPIVPEEAGSLPADSLTAGEVQTENAQKSSPGKYRIQLIAVSTAGRAQTLVDDLTAKYAYPAFFEKSGKLYKVFAGPYADESEARQVLEKVRKSGYPDAWLVY
jgi:hypothetical protein